MSDLITCPKCDKVFHSTAIKPECPHCRAKHSKLGAVIVLGVIAAVSYAAFSSDSGTAATHVTDAQLERANAAIRNAGPVPTSVDLSVPGDPYAASQQAIHENTYANLKADFLARAQRIYYATTCRALDTPVPQAIVQDEAAAFLQEAFGVPANMGDEKLTADIEAAERAGVAQATASGGCEYWKQNPEAVAQIRDEARLAQPGAP